jgi:hypothetical protein
VSWMTADGGGEVVFAAEGASPEMRGQLLSLVEELLADHARSPVTLRLRFRSEVLSGGSSVRNGGAGSARARHEREAKAPTLVERHAGAPAAARKAD